VLVVAIDDLRPETEPCALRRSFACWLSATCRRCALTSVCAASYGFSHMSTPHFAKFAASATVFERAYVAVALCMPSRTAILTSRRADTTMDWDVRRAAACLVTAPPALTVAYRAPPQISAKQNFRQCGGNACAANQCGPTCGIRDLVTLKNF